MATNEPPLRKRKVEEITPTAVEGITPTAVEGITPTAVEGITPTTDEGTTVEKIIPTDGRTFYVLEQGKFVPVKAGGGGYVSPSGYSSDEDVDPVREAEYYRQIRESDGFDLNMYIPNGSMLPFRRVDDDDYEIAICAKFGLHWYNIQKGSNIRLLRLEKYNSTLTGMCTYYITADAMDPATDSRVVFQTCVTRCWCTNSEDFRIMSEVGRIKPDTQGGEYGGVESDRWDEEAIDDFYTSDLNWLPDDALVQSHQYYELQDSDIRQSDWLNLYAECAFFSLCQNRMTKLKFGVPLEIKKVVVRTREAMEPKEKLKAGNAIFYISFSDSGQTEDHRAVVSRTTDGDPEHVSLAVKCPVRDLSSCSTD